MGGCCCPSSSMEEPLASDQPQQISQTPSCDHKNRGIFGSDGDWPFTEFFFSDLETATKNFSSDEILSENGDESSNVVYKGQFKNLGFIAVKKFQTTAWSDPDQFGEEAQRVGKLKYKKVVNLLGYCCDGDERLLVSEFLPNHTLAKRLFDQKSQTMEWETRLKVAYCVAEALDYCSNAGFASYSNLSAYTVLFDENDDACLSCFGFVKEIDYDRRTTGSVNSESVTYRFGTVLLNLLSGKQIPPSHAVEMIKENDVIGLMDPKLEGNFSAVEATAVFELASKCLQYGDSLKTKHLVATLKALHTKTEVPTFEMGETSSWSQEIQIEALRTQLEDEAASNIISPLGEACWRMDLNAIHEILVKSQSEDDKNALEYSFQEWLPSMDAVDTFGKLGDEAFEEKDFEFAIHCYSKVIEARNVVLPSVYARRCLSYIFCDKIKAAHLDMVQAHQVYPDWSTGYYLMSVVLAKADMGIESAGILRQATLLDDQKRLNTIVREEES